MNYVIFAFLLIINTLVGSPLVSPLILVNIISIIIFITILLLKRKKFVFFENIVDYLIVFLLLLPCTNIVLKNYISLEESYKAFLNGFSLILFYFSIKNICSNKEKMLNIIIYSTLPIIVIGMDILSSGVMWNFLYEKVPSLHYLSSINRFTANFDYPNSLAIYLGSVAFILLYKIIKTDNLFFKLYLNILFIFIILTQSRATILLLILFLIWYLYKEKDKNLIKLLFTNLILIILFLIVNKFLYNSFITVFIIFIVNLFINIFCKDIKINLSYKKILLAFTSVLVIMFLLLIYFLNCSKPLEVNYNKIELSLLKNKKYNIEINFSNSLEKTPLNIKIFYIYQNEEYKLISNNYINSDKKSYSFKVYLDDSYNDGKNVLILLNNEDDNELYLDSMFINDKKYIVNYKYLPNSLGYKIKSLSLNNKSLTERLKMYRDGIKIFTTDNVYFGTGPYTWFSKYKKYQTSYYVVNVMHSYFFETLLSYGLNGVIILLLLVYSLIIIKKKKKSNEDFAIFIAISIIFIHSLIDIDMNFMVIKYYLIFLICLYVNKIKDNFYIKNKYINIVSIFLALLFLYINICYFSTINLDINNSLLKYNFYSKNNYLEIEDDYDNLIKYNNYSYIEIIKNKVSDFRKIEKYKYMGDIYILEEQLISFEINNKNYDFDLFIQYYKNVLNNNFYTNNEKCVILNNYADYLSNNKLDSVSNNIKNSIEEKNICD